MIKIIEVKEGVLLKDYELYASLAMPLRELYTEASLLVPKIKERKIWMINSTAQGGGVAEMMPRMISFLRQLGLNAEWVVASSEQKEFFSLTKKIHNLIHGVPQDRITEEEIRIYEKENENNALEFLQLAKPDDIIVIHDPQPLPMALYLNNKIELHFIWRCHIGLDKHTDITSTAWKFLQHYITQFQTSIFSATEYIPFFLTGNAIVIPPGIDPLDHKNRDMPLPKLVGVLCNSNLVSQIHPVLSPPFTDPARKLQYDGSFQSPLLPNEIGILFRPLIVQISRWDRLKGFLPLMKGFIELKNNKKKYYRNDRHSRKIELANLILAGPDPNFVNDDPEGNESLNELIDFYKSIPNEIKKDIAILKLPMTSRKYNELIVNSLQRAASIVVQNSIREGFGLTVTEAMWKAKNVIGSSACGIREQIRDKIDGELINDPLDVLEIADTLNLSLKNEKNGEVHGYNAQKRVIEHFLIFTQVRKWLRLFASL
jgi:trehalose synthase